MKLQSLLQCVTLLLPLACSQTQFKNDVARVPQSVEISQTSDCGKKITEYHDVHSQNYLKMFPVCQKAQLKIMGSYLHGLKSQIGRLLVGINQERNFNPQGKTLGYYKQYLGELVAKTTYINAIYYQLKNQKVENLCRPFAFSDVTLDEDSFRETIEKAKKAGQEKGLMTEIGDKFLGEVIKDSLKAFSKEVFYEVRDLVLEQIAWHGFKSIVRESAKGIVKGVVISALKGTIISLAVKPLKSGTVPPESKWYKIILDNPEIMINPEWMEMAGLKTMNPWLTHGSTLKKHKDKIQSLLAKLLNQSENTFQNHVRYLANLEEKLEREEWQRKFPVAPAESTRVHIPANIKEYLPAWAKK